MKLEKEHLLKLYANLVRARAIDDLFTRRLSQGKLWGSTTGVKKLLFIR